MPLPNLLGIALTLLGLIAIYLVYRRHRKAEHEREEMKRSIDRWSDTEWRAFVASMEAKHGKH